MIVTSTMESTRPSNPAVRRAFIPTMGALHEGHRQLMREARRHVGDDGAVVVSVFVNPTQFAAGEDFDTYPRGLEADTRACDAEGVDIVYAPTVEQVYGTSPTITVDPGPLAADLEGRARPTHFAGVLTVVSILFHQVAPHIAIFGEKDYQQLELIRRMCADLAFPVQVIGVETVREDDGLARSSRNVYLSPSERRQAAAIPRALQAGVAVAGDGAQAVRSAAIAELDEAGLAIDYVEVRGRDLGPAPTDGEGRLLIAVNAGATRLIDNCRVDLGRGGR